jgi:hypothetical protein
MSEYTTRCNVPQVRDLAKAVEMYYTRHELAPADIRTLFGCSASTAQKLRRRGKEQMAMDGVPAWNDQYVNTACAFRSWGLEIEKLEQGLRALRRLKLIGEETTR